MDVFKNENINRLMKVKDGCVGMNARIERMYG